MFFRKAKYLDWEEYKAKVIFLSMFSPNLPAEELKLNDSIHYMRKLP